MSGAINGMHAHTSLLQIVLVEKLAFHEALYFVITTLTTGAHSLLQIPQIVVTIDLA